MKILIYFPVAFLFYSGTIKPKSDPKTTYYYFCISRSMHTDNVTAKQFILITDIAKTCDEKDLPVKTKDWKKLVDNQCKNPTGCSSDLNSYLDQRRAEDQLEIASKRYSDTFKYVINKVNLQ